MLYIWDDHFWGVICLRKGLYNALIIVICIVTWLILKERLDWQNILLGAALGVIALLFNNFVLHHDTGGSTTTVNPLVLPRYLFNLIIQIYVAGFDTIKRIITGDINPEIIEIEANLDNDFYVCLLANSITLTPGTVTVEKEGNKLTVLWLNCVTRDKSAAGELIKGKFERILRGG